MARFILHVGDMKCGSTSIQASLKRARVALAQKGLIYDVGEIGHSRFSVLHLVRPHSRGNLETFLARGRRIVAQLRETVTDDDVVLLSAEGLLAIPPEDFLPVLRQIEPGDPDISVIAYVRSPTEMYLSHAQQALKGSGEFPQPDGYARPVDRFLTTWRDCPCLSEMHVRHFDRSRLQGGDVIKDFAAVLGQISGQEISLPNAQGNQSLSVEQEIVLQRPPGFASGNGRQAAPAEQALHSVVHTDEQGGAAWQQDGCINKRPFCGGTGKRAHRRSSQRGVPRSEYGISQMRRI